MAKRFEIERKFLVQTLPAGWKRLPHSKIVQGYLPISEGDSLEIRLRQKRPQYFLTVKAGHGKMRLEVEIPLTKRQFSALWPLTEGSRISKVRYNFRWEGHWIEIDIYDGVHRGLITADVEFPSEKASLSFEPPAWLGQEITGDKKYSNRLLSQKKGNRRRTNQLNPMVGG